MKRIVPVVFVNILFTLIAIVPLGLLVVSASQANSPDIYCVVESVSRSCPDCDRVFTDIQSAIYAVLEGEEIRIAGGIYTNVHQRAGITQVIYIDKDVTLRGGYSSDLKTNSLSDNPTILDAQGRGRVIYATGGVSITLENLNITGGDATAFSGEGGGIYFNGVTATLRYNQIYSNTASRNALALEQFIDLPVMGLPQLGVQLSSPPVIARDQLFRLQHPTSVLSIQNYQPRSEDAFDANGGGIYATQSVLVLSDNEIFSNSAGISIDEPIDYASGGGLAVESGELTFERNIVKNNVACNYGDFCEGGGLRVDASTSININDNLIANNVANIFGNSGNGGGVVLSATHIVLNDNMIMQNQAIQNITGNLSFNIGGGAFVSGGCITVTNNQIISNTGIFTGNSLSGQAVGGGITISGEEVRLNSNTVQGNVGTAFGYFGMGGGLYFEDVKHLALTNNLIKDNIATIDGHGGDGGGLMIAQYRVADMFVMMDNNIIQGNTGIISGGGVGGGMFLGSYSPDLPPVQVIFQNNQILSNTAVISGTFGPGGGVVMAGCDMIMSNNIFRDNSAQSSGGGLYLSVAKAVMENTVFTGNQSAVGGSAVTIDDHSDVRMLHSTVTDNTGGDGSGVLLYDWEDAGSTVRMTNTIIVSQTVGISVTSESALFVNSVLWHNTPITITAKPVTTVTIHNQFNGDPKLSSDNYHLSSNSAAIGLGIESGTRRDIDRQPRHSPPDLGSDEYWYSLTNFYLPLILYN